MRFLYGRQDFKNLERAQETCYLLTNGLGGFSSCTMANSNTRNDHALLMACIKPPNCRYNMIHRLAETLLTGKKKLALSTQEFYEGRKKDEEGYRYLTSFSFEDIPEWFYQTDGVEITKQIGMEPGENTVAVRYAIRNWSREECVLSVIPWMQFTKKGEDLSREQDFAFLDDRIESNGLTVWFSTNGTVRVIPDAYEEYEYSYDACDGRRDHGLGFANHEIRLRVPGNQRGQLELVYSMRPVTVSAEAVIEDIVHSRRELEETAGFASPTAGMLAKSAGQFIASRESVGGATILAGYPFFEDWGRDTMIAAVGLTIATRQYETTKSILKTFLAHRKRGLMPNLFPEGGREPVYNTVDAALLFINCVWLYYERTGDTAFVLEAYPAMKEIVDFYERGTDYGIHMDEDGLMMAGCGLDQVTWMDVRVGDILPTPRHGKPVEINAYWYNALCIMNEISPLAGEPQTVYSKMAETVKRSFLAQFWMEEKGCLRDVVSGTKADEQIRCNQIWAVSLPFTMLPRRMEKAVVDMVFEKLYTPYGLRTLSADDAQFQPRYGGSQMERDLAYHQGTVWVYLLGEYYLAYLKVHDNTREAARYVRERLEVMECAMREGCVGQLPEIYDGMTPSSSKGCFAQAWSVGEILRVYEMIEERR